MRWPRDVKIIGCGKTANVDLELTDIPGERFADLEMIEYGSYDVWSDAGLRPIWL